MSATLTHRPEAPNSVSDHTQVPAPKKTGRWALLAVVVALAVGFVGTNTTVDDGSSAFAEAQRQQALAPIQTPDASSQTAELQRHLALADGTAPDSSFQFAEAQRMAALAAPVDSSVQFAETQRMIAAGDVSAAGDKSHERAESQRMQALEPTGK